MTMGLERLVIIRGPTMSAVPQPRRKRTEPFSRRSGTPLRTPSSLGHGGQVLQMIQGGLLALLVGDGMAGEEELLAELTQS